MSQEVYICVTFGIGSLAYVVNYGNYFPTGFGVSILDVMLTIVPSLADSEHLARTVVKDSKSCHITSILCSIHWLKITKRIKYKLLSLTYKVHKTTQPPYCCNLISVQCPRSTRSSSVATLARPPTSSFLKNN